MLYVFIFLELIRLYNVLYRYKKKEEIIIDKNFYLVRFF